MARPQHDKVADLKRRELTFSHWRAAILRGSIDHRTLTQELNRALADPEVRKDPTLAGMIRDYAAQRMRDITSLKPQHTAQQTLGVRPTATSQPDTDHSVPHIAHEEEVRSAVDRLMRHFDEYASHFYDTEARASLERLCELRQAYPQWVDETIVAHCTEALQSLATRRQEYAAHIEQLADQAVHAAEAGDHAAAPSILRRLAGINATHPHMLSDHEFARIRERMTRAGSVHEHHVAIQNLIERERKIAAEIRTLAAVVHDFHKIARTTLHNTKEFRDAEARYHVALAEVKTHDKEWLASMILELLDLLGEWTHPPPKIEAQIDQFVSAVRASLHQLRSEIREVESELGSSPARNRPSE